MSLVRGDKFDRRVFSQRASLFREATVRVFASSEEKYTALPHRLDATLRMCDRVVAACRDHRAFNKVPEVAVHLEKVAADPSDDSEVRSLLIVLEQWLKAIFWLVKPLKEYDRVIGKGTATLRHVIRGLDLLSEDEIQLGREESARIGSPVRENILRAYLLRNRESHDTSREDGDGRLAFRAALVSLLAPVYVYRAELSSRLSGLITRPLEVDSELDTLLKTVAGERRRHLDRFVGRQECIESCTRSVASLQKAGGYLLITASEGGGKSALAARLSQVLGRCADSLGREAAEVQEVAPWLPGVLLHMGKQSSQGREIVRFLLAQANSLLLDTVSEVPVEEGVVPEGLVAVGVEAFRKRVGSRTDLDLGNWLPARCTGEDMGASSLRRALYRVLEHIVAERGHAILILDALDEIAGPDGELQFLPEVLPPGACGILTCRPNTSVEKGLLQLQEMKHIGLEALTPEETRLAFQKATGLETVSDDISLAVWENSHGWPLCVQMMARDDMDMEAFETHGSMDAILERQANAWRSGESRETQMLKESLLALAILEPACALSLDDLQGFLQHRGFDDLRKAELRGVLQRSVGVQLEGFDADRVKLAVKRFAEYVLRSYHSRKDVRRGLEALVSWFSEDDDVHPGVLASFLAHWSSQGTCSDAASRTIAQGLVENLGKKGAAERLGNVARHLAKGDEHALQLETRCLRIAATLGAARAMRGLGFNLMQGEGCQKDEVEGLDWLRKAADLNDAPAMKILAIHHTNLCKEFRRGEENSEAVLHWLRQAASHGDIKGLWGLLGVLLLLGTGDERQQGEAWLRVGVQEGDLLSMYFLGENLLTGDYLEKNAIEGEGLLRRAAEAGFADAQTHLASRLYHGDGVEKRRDEAIGWLRTAANSGHLPAVCELGARIVAGEVVEEVQGEGACLFRKAAQEGYVPAATILAVALLGREFVEFSNRRKWLASLMGVQDESERALTEGLLKWELTEEYPGEGRFWLKKAAEDNGALARVYGERLLDGNGVPQDTREGERLLRRSAEAGNTQAMFMLAERLEKGLELELRPDEALAWYRRAAEKGHPEAVFKLVADPLLSEETGSPVENELIEWLYGASESSGWPVQLLLGAFLLTGMLQGDGTEGKRVLEEAVNAARDAGERVEAGSEAMGLYLKGYRELAACFFWAGASTGTDNGANNLAYVKRRGELPSALGDVSVQELLEPAIERGEVFPIVNKSLCLARGFEYPLDWGAADRLMATVPPDRVGDLMEWWHAEVAARNDPEGHLVVGWLARHRLAEDPDGLDLAARLTIARDGGWEVPDWMMGRAS